MDPLDPGDGARRDPASGARRLAAVAWGVAAFGLLAVRGDFDPTAIILVGLVTGPSM